MYYFVGGYPRTGTTLVGEMLCGDPETNPPLAEVSYLEYMMIPYDMFIHGWEGNHGGQFDDEDEFWEFHRNYLELFLEHLRVKHKCKKLVVKRPLLSRWFPSLAQMFPESRYVICIRDPRDVIGSLKMVQAKHRMLDAETQGVNPFLDQGLTDLAYGYTYGILQAREGAREFPDRFHFILYEDLVRNPDESMERIGKALDLDLSLNKEHWELYKNYSGNNPFHSSGWGGEITTRNIGKYRTQLDSDEVKMVETVCHLIMEAFGYDKTSG